MAFRPEPPMSMAIVMGDLFAVDAPGAGAASLRILEFICNELYCPEGIFRLRLDAERVPLH